MDDDTATAGGRSVALPAGVHVGPVCCPARRLVYCKNITGEIFTSEKNEKRSTMKKLSKTLRGLADRAENAEKKVEAAENETRDKVESHVEASKAHAKARQDEFKAKVVARKTAAGSDWEKLQADHNQRVEKIKSTLGAKKDAVSQKVAAHRADDAEDYATSSIDFALIAIDDAEIATLEAVDARAYAESLA